MRQYLLLSMPIVLCPAHVLAAQVNSNAPHRTKFATELGLGQAERSKGRTVAALERFEAAYRVADADKDPTERARALLFISGSQIRLFRYQDALRTVDAAQQAAIAAGNRKIEGAAACNRATVYGQVGDTRHAEQSVREAISLLKDSGSKDYYATALINLGDIESDAGSLKASETHLRQAIITAHAAGLDELEAFAEDHLGTVLLQGQEYAGAAEALERAKNLRTKLKDADGLVVTTRSLANLAYREGRLSEALRLLDQAMGSRSNRLSTIPAYWSHQLRGEIQLGLNRKGDALASFAQAVTAADKWRRYALPGDVTSTLTAATLDGVYRDYIDLAAEVSLQRHDLNLAREALTVLAVSRAASLREQRVASLDSQLQLPPRYFELLSRLQAAEASLTLGGSSKQGQSLTDSLQRTRDELADLENKAGIRQTNISALGEKVLNQKTLSSIQRSLSPDQLLLSFSLGKKKSFLWGVSRNRLELYELPPEDILYTHASAYFSALQKGNAHREGMVVTKDLFRQLHPALAAKREWLISADGVLLDHVPFAALPSIGKPNSSETLIAAHSLRFIPSEPLIVDRKPQQPAAKFIGVADPVYNRADGRLPRTATLVTVSRTQPGITLARLAGSGSEVRSAAKASGVTDMQFLTGTNASEAKLRGALATPPSVLHFAVHVISPATGESGNDESSGDTALALSLTPSGVPELLTKEAIARLRVPGTLVVLSGCGSQRGQIVPGAGLIGLGRAWLLAGAAAVIVSAWPTPDNSGEFFADFYSRLNSKSSKAANLAERASAALQEAQLDMQRSAGYRSSPSFWAAYSMISEE